jgi:3-hexulose-6-phosphate synthase
MKLHFTYNLPDLAQSLSLAKQTAEHADVIGIGSLLLLAEGVRAVKEFKKAFPHKPLCAEAKITERADEAVMLLAQAGATHITVLAGAFYNSIKKAVETAHRLDVKVILDLLDAPSLGQTAMDAKSLGADILILHRSPGEEMSELDNEWQNVRDNSTLPVFITGKIDETTIAQIVALKPQGIIVSTLLAKSDNPAKTAAHLRSFLV